MASLTRRRYRGNDGELDAALRDYNALQAAKKLQLSGCGGEHSDASTSGVAATKTAAVHARRRRRQSAIPVAAQEGALPHYQRRRPAAPKEALVLYFNLSLGMHTWVRLMPVSDGRDDGVAILFVVQDESARVAVMAQELNLMAARLLPEENEAGNRRRGRRKGDEGEDSLQQRLQESWQGKVRATASLPFECADYITGLGNFLCVLGAETAPGSSCLWSYACCSVSAVK